MEEESPPTVAQRARQAWGGPLRVRLEDDSEGGSPIRLKGRSFGSSNMASTTEASLADLPVHRSSMHFLKASVKHVASVAKQETGSRLAGWLTSVRYSDGGLEHENSTKMDGWRTDRILLHKIVSSQLFEGLMGVIIVVNIGLIWWETDYRAQCYPNWADEVDSCPFDPDKLDWLNWSNRVLLAIYTLEAMTRIYAQRTQYFQNRWNILDFFVVCVSYITLGIQDIAGVGFLRIFRMTRLVRAIRIVLSIRELYMLVTGLASSMKAIFFGTILLLTMLGLWSIVLVDFVHPLNSAIQFDGCDRCHLGFKTVEASVLTLFQTIVAGDSWGEIAVPLIENHPQTALILGPLLISVSLGIMNLILAVIVESAAEARERDLEEKAKQRQREQKRIRVEVLKVFDDLSTKHQQKLTTITEADLMTAWEVSPAFRKIMMSLNLNQHDLKSMFSILDMDESGDVDYREFFNRLMELQTSEWRMLVGMNQYQMKKVTADMGLQLDRQASELDRLASKIDTHFGCNSPQATASNVSGAAPRKTPQEVGRSRSATGDAESVTTAVVERSTSRRAMEVKSIFKNRSGSAPEALPTTPSQAASPTSRTSRHGILHFESEVQSDGGATSSAGLNNFYMPSAVNPEQLTSTFGSLVDACNRIASKATDQQALLKEQADRISKASNGELEGQLAALQSGVQVQIEDLARRFEEVVRRQNLALADGNTILSSLTPHLQGQCSIVGTGGLLGEAGAKTLRASGETKERDRSDSTHPPSTSSKSNAQPPRPLRSASATDGLNGLSSTLQGLATPTPSPPPISGSMSAAMSEPKPPSESLLEPAPLVGPATIGTSSMAASALRRVAASFKR